LMKTQVSCIKLERQQFATMPAPAGIAILG